MDQNESPGPTTQEFPVWGSGDALEPTSAARDPSMRIIVAVRGGGTAAPVGPPTFGPAGGLGPGGSADRAILARPVGSDPATGLTGLRAPLVPGGSGAPSTAAAAGGGVVGDVGPGEGAPGPGVAPVSSGPDLALAVAGFGAAGSAVRVIAAMCGS